MKLHDLSVGKYLADKYALWLDFRMIDKNTLHRMSRKIGSAMEGIILQIEKKAETAEALKAHIYIIMDVQLNIQNGEYVSAIY